MSNSQIKQAVYIIAISLCLAIPTMVNAEGTYTNGTAEKTCKIVPVIKKFQFCNKSTKKCTPYVTNMTVNNPENYTTNEEIVCPSDKYEMDSTKTLCSIGDCSSDDIYDASQSIEASCNGTTKSYDYTASFSKTLSPSANCQSDTFCSSYGYNSYVDGPLMVEVKAIETHKLFFSKVPDSLVDVAKGTQFAPGTGVTFEIEYDQDIEWQTLVDCPEQYRYTEQIRPDKRERTCTCEAIPGPTTPPDSPKIKVTPADRPPATGTHGIGDEIDYMISEGMLPPYWADLNIQKEIQERYFPDNPDISDEDTSYISRIEDAYTKEIKRIYNQKISGSNAASDCLSYSASEVERTVGTCCPGGWEEGTCEDAYGGTYSCSHCRRSGIETCITYQYYCHYCSSSQCEEHPGCYEEQPTITTPNVESEVTVTTQTTKGEDVQGLGSFKADENNIQSKTAWSGDIRNKYLFTNPKVFINIKTGDICYQKPYGKPLTHTIKGQAKSNICSNEVPNNLWKEITSGYYIPINAIPETESVIEANLSNMGYIITLFGQTKQVDIKAQLVCEFEVKIPGCPIQPCGETECNPNTDEYKCCRNSAYLDKHPEYYGKSCTGVNYLYRQIDLNDPFPNREAGTNWVTWIEDIKHQQELKQSYSNNPEYSVDLTPSLIKSIREYNDIESSKYTSWVDINDDGSSNFLKPGTNDGRVLGNNLKATLTTDYYALGCGPSNVGQEGYRWCD